MEEHEYEDFIEQSTETYSSIPILNDSTPLSKTISYCPPSVVMEKIQQLVVQFLADLMKKKTPSFFLISRSKKNTYYDSKQRIVRLGTLTTKRTLYDGQSYVRTWYSSRIIYQTLRKLLETCFLLLKYQKTVNQREVWFSLFSVKNRFTIWIEMYILFCASSYQ